MTKENLLTFDQIKQQLHGEPEAIIMAMTVTGRKTQEEIDHAKAFWKTPEGYKKKNGMDLFVQWRIFARSINTRLCGLIL